MKTNSKNTFNIPVIIERDESGYFVGIVPSLRSCYTQAKTLPKLYERLRETVALSLEIEKNFSRNPLNLINLLVFKIWSSLNNINYAEISACHSAQTN